MTALNRLNKYRAEAAKWLEKQPTYIHYHNWRAHRRTAQPRFGFAGDGKTMWLDNHREAPNLRHYYEAHELVRLGHTGWYSDNFQHGTIIPTVSVMRFGKWAYVVAGYTHSDWDSDTLFWDTAERMPAREAWDADGYRTAALDEMMDDMARTADRKAKRTAEICREDDMKYQAQQRIEELTDEIATARDHIRTLAREIKAHGAYTPAVCETLQDTILSQWREIQAWRKQIKKLTDQPWTVIA
jgi:hypothetical protein